jgi:hypothetical protein
MAVRRILDPRLIARLVILERVSATRGWLLMELPWVQVSFAELAAG